MLWELQRGEKKSGSEKAGRIDSEENLETNRFLLTPGNSKHFRE